MATPPLEEKTHMPPTRSTELLDARKDDDFHELYFNIKVNGNSYDVIDFDWHVREFLAKSIDSIALFYGQGKPLQSNCSETEYSIFVGTLKSANMTFEKFRDIFTSSSEGSIYPNVSVELQKVESRYVTFHENGRVSVSENIYSSRINAIKECINTLKAAHSKSIELLKLLQKSGISDEIIEEKKAEIYQLDKIAAKQESALGKRYPNLFDSQRNGSDNNNSNSNIQPSYSTTLSK